MTERQEDRLWQTSVDRRLADILDQTTKTNGRVGRLEDTSEQHHRLLLGSDEERSSGLVADVRRNNRIVDQVEVGILWLKRAVWALLAAVLTLGGNLAFNALS